jgi:hypothetical protein
LADYSQFENEYKNVIPLIESQLGREKLRGNGSCARGRDAPAPNSGMGLWTACTRLKTEELRAAIFD